MSRGGLQLLFLFAETFANHALKRSEHSGNMDSILVYQLKSSNNVAFI